MIYSDGTFKEGFFENNVFKIAIEEEKYMNNLNYFLSRSSNTNFRSTHASTIFWNIASGEILIKPNITLSLKKLKKTDQSI